MVNDRANCSFTPAVRQVSKASIGAETDSQPTCQDIRDYNDLIVGSFKRSVEAASHNAYLRSRFLISSKASATPARLRSFNSG
jgi:hypothetical protein